MSVSPAEVPFASGANPWRTVKGSPRSSAAEKHTSDATEDSVEDVDRLRTATRRGRGAAPSPAPVFPTRHPVRAPHPERSEMDKFIEEAEQDDNPVWVSRSLLKKPQLVALVR